MLKPYLQKDDTQLTSIAQVLQNQFQDKTHQISIQYYKTKILGQTKFYQFMVQNMEEGRVLLRIDEITKFIDDQWHLCNKTYQDAIESNYSHEQMTPLNNIISNANLIETYLNSQHKNNFKALVEPLISQIKQSGKIMFFHNQSMI